MGVAVSVSYMASHEWAQQDLNLRPSDYEDEPARSPMIVAARSLGLTFVGDHWARAYLLLRFVTVLPCPFFLVKLLQRRFADAVFPALEKIRL